MRNSLHIPGTGEESSSNACGVLSRIETRRQESSAERKIVQLRLLADVTPEGSNRESKTVLKPDAALDSRDVL